MALRRQLASFAGIGLLQWLLDTAVMIALSRWGLAVGLAVVAGRVSGALLGYLLNGRYTFAAGRRSALDRASLLRFIVFWLAATLASAWLLAWVDARAGLHASWLGKPLVDGLMAVGGFVAARHWIYRNR